MPDKRTAKQPDRLLYMGGQVNALFAFVAASVQSHPDRPALHAGPGHLFGREHALRAGVEPMAPMQVVEQLEHGARV